MWHSGGSIVGEAECPSQQVNQQVLPHFSQWSRFRFTDEPIRVQGRKAKSLRCFREAEVPQLLEGLAGVSGSTLTSRPLLWDHPGVTGCRKLGNSKPRASCFQCQVRVAQPCSLQPPSFPGVCTPNPSCQVPCSFSAFPGGGDGASPLWASTDGDTSTVICAWVLSPRRCCQPRSLQCGD